MTRLDAVADAGPILRLLELAKLAAPVLENAFPASTVPATPLVIEPAPNPRLLAMPEPPMPSARCARNVVVAEPHNHGPQDGLGPRLIRAVTGYGWRGELRSFRATALVADLEAVRDVCLETKADLLVMVESGADEGLKQRSSLLAELRARQPDMLIVLFFADPWCRRRWPWLRAAAAMADRVWAPFPSIELWRQGVFEHKLLYFPIPLGPPRPLPPVNGAMRLSFTGTIYTLAWMRKLWLAASREAGIDLHHSLPSAQEAGLPALDSYDHYLTRLAATGASVNLTMRIDGTRTLVGRSFEIPRAGALLVEEHNDDIEYYFTPGEHMLTFSTLPELMAIADLIRDRPELVETIRRRGHAFATERYSDTRIIGGIDLALWPDGRA
jgi:glycosyl transferase family 1